MAVVTLVYSRWKVTVRECVRVRERGKERESVGVRVRAGDVFPFNDRQRRYR